MTVRTNWALDPAATGTGLWETALASGSATTSYLGPISSPPFGVHASTIRRVQPDGDVPNGTVVQHVYRASPAGWSVPAGESLTGSIYLRSMDRDVEARLGVYDAMAGAIVTYGPWVDVTGHGAGVAWERLSATDLVDTQTSTGYQLRVQIRQHSAGPQILAGDRFDVTGLLVEKGSTLAAFFYGGSPSGPLLTNTWNGVPNESTSTQVSATITATVLTTGQPQPVQVLVEDVPDGLEYEVVGSTLGGRTWSVPGGVGIADGGQVLLVDTRAPVNTPVQYVLTAGQESVTSDPVEVPWTPHGDVSHRYLIQSLDGQTIVPVRSWRDNGLPRDYPLHTSAFDIHGRRRPVVVLSPAGDGSTSATVLLDRAAGETLDEILGEGGAVCVRTTGKERDLAPSDIAVITSVSSVLWGGDNGISTSREWTLTLTWIDDPEPGTVPTVWTWGDIDTLLGGMTWGEVDAEFAGMTWGEFDATDWGQVS